MQTEADTVGVALDENNQRMQVLLDGLKEAGIALGAIQTSLSPRYDSSGNGAANLVGHEVINTVSVTVRNRSTFGAMLDKVVQIGGNEIDGISFGFSDPAALLDQGREAAIAYAQHKAAQLAVFPFVPEIL